MIHDTLNHQSRKCTDLVTRAPQHASPRLCITVTETAIVTLVTLVTLARSRWSLKSISPPLWRELRKRATSLFPFGHWTG